MARSPQPRKVIVASSVTLLGSLGLTLVLRSLLPQARVEIHLIPMILCVAVVVPMVLSYIRKKPTQ